MRASGTDEALILTPPVLHTLEQALEFIDSDELVEVTPESIRLRKKLLLEHERKRASRAAARDARLRSCSRSNFLRRRMLSGVTSTNSSESINSSACSRV